MSVIKTVILTSALTVMTSALTVMTSAPSGKPSSLTVTKCILVAKMLQDAQKYGQLYEVYDHSAVRTVSLLYQNVSGMASGHDRALYWPMSQDRVTFFLGRGSKVCEAIEIETEAYSRIIRSMGGEV